MRQASQSNKRAKLFIAGLIFFASLAVVGIGVRLAFAQPPGNVISIDLTKSITEGPDVTVSVNVTLNQAVNDTVTVNFTTAGQPWRATTLKLSPAH